MADVFSNVEDYIEIMDADGNEPGVRVIASNRTAGKTYSCVNRALKKYVENKEAFVLVTRTQGEAQSADDVLKEVLCNEHPQLKTVVKNVGNKLARIVKEEESGDTVAISFCLNDADKIKKLRSIFMGVKRGILDEFQAENYKTYLPQEVHLFLSVCYTLAGGDGQHARQIEWWLLGNSYTQLNPYLLALNAYQYKPEILPTGEKLVRGSGFIYVEFVNEDAKRQLSQLAVSRAFSHDSFVQYSTANATIYSDEEFITDLKERYRYIFTYIFDGKKYGVLELKESGNLYITDKTDPSATVFVFNAGEHNENTLLMSNRSGLSILLRDSYDHAAVRFKDLKCKNSFLHIVGREIF